MRIGHEGEQSAGRARWTASDGQEHSEEAGSNLSQEQPIKIVSSTYHKRGGGVVSTQLTITPMAGQS